MAAQSAARSPTPGYPRPQLWLASTQVNVVTFAIGSEQRTGPGRRWGNRAGTRRRRQEIPRSGPGLLRRPRRTHRAFHPCRRLLQEHGPGPGGQLAGSGFPVLPHTRFAICSSSMTSVCTGSQLNSQQISTSSSSIAIGRPASSSPATGPWTNGSVFLTIPSSATAPWIGWLTPATRSSSRAPVTANGYRRTAPCWAEEVIDQTTAT